MAVPDDAKDVLCALRLGWFLAEVRGRNRPGGQLGATADMPDRDYHALPLRIERSATELRIQAQRVVAQLAKDLKVDADGDGTSFSDAIDDEAELLSAIRAPKASKALKWALDQLVAAGQSHAGDAGPLAAEHVLQKLQEAASLQRRVVARRRQAVAAAEDGRATAEAALRRSRAAASGEQAGLDALEQTIAALEADEASEASAAQARADLIQKHLQGIADSADKPWKALAHRLWRFDAHIQDLLGAISETQACAYQLGRGLAETYWALDPDSTAGSRGWDFLLGQQRCTELARLAGRLGAYMPEYTAPAIAASIEIWRCLAADPAWRGDGQAANDALHRQIRRWYELIVLGQEPTTLIRPNALIPGCRLLGRAIRLFWPQLAATITGLGFLVAFLVLLTADNGATWEKTLSGILAAAGFSLAGLTGALKNSAQAMLKRLRQDSYTDLVAIAVQTTPPPPRKSDLRKGLQNRRLTPATPN